jgi:hypothetical protein
MSWYLLVSGRHQSRSAVSLEPVDGILKIGVVFLFQQVVPVPRTRSLAELDPGGALGSAA